MIDSYGPSSGKVGTLANNAMVVRSAAVESNQVLLVRSTVAKHVCLAGYSVLVHSVAAKLVEGGSLGGEGMYCPRGGSSYSSSTPFAVLGCTKEARCDKKVGLEVLIRSPGNNLVF